MPELTPGKLSNAWAFGKDESTALRCRKPGCSIAVAPKNLSCQKSFCAESAANLFVIFPVSDPRTCTNTTQRDFRQPKTPPFMKCTLYIGLTAPKTRAYGSGELFGICQNPGSAAPYARACGTKIAKRPGFWQGRVYGATGVMKYHLYKTLVHYARNSHGILV